MPASSTGEALWRPALLLARAWVGRANDSVECAGPGPEQAPTEPFCEKLLLYYRRQKLLDMVDDSTEEAADDWLTRALGPRAPFLQFYAVSAEARRAAAGVRPLSAPRFPGRARPDLS